MIPRRAAKVFSFLFLYSSILPGLRSQPAVSHQRDLSLCSPLTCSAWHMLFMWSERKAQQYLLLFHAFTKVQYLRLSLYLITFSLLPKSCGIISDCWDIWWQKQVPVLHRTPVVLSSKHFKIKIVLFRRPYNTYGEEKWSEVGKDTLQCVHVEESCQWGWGSSRTEGTQGKIFVEQSTNLIKTNDQILTAEGEVCKTWRTLISLLCTTHQNKQHTWSPTGPM